MHFSICLPKSHPSSYCTSHLFSHIQPIFQQHFDLPILPIFPLSSHLYHLSSLSVYHTTHRPTRPILPLCLSSLHAHLSPYPTSHSGHFHCANLLTQSIFPPCQSAPFSHLPKMSIFPHCPHYHNAFHLRLPIPPSTMPSFPFCRSSHNAYFSTVPHPPTPHIFPIFPL